MAYERKTKDVWELHTDYHEGTGYEYEATATTKGDAMALLAKYNEAEPQYTHKLVKKRKGDGSHDRLDLDL